MNLKTSTMWCVCVGARTCGDIICWLCSSHLSQESLLSPCSSSCHHFFNPLQVLSRQLSPFTLTLSFFFLLLTSPPVSPSAALFYPSQSAFLSLHFHIESNTVMLHYTCLDTHQTSQVQHAGLSERRLGFSPPSEHAHEVDFTVSALDQGTGLDTVRWLPTSLSALFKYRVLF